MSIDLFAGHLRLFVNLNLRLDAASLEGEEFKGLGIYFDQVSPCLHNYWGSRCLSVAEGSHCEWDQPNLSPRFISL